MSAKSFSLDVKNVAKTLHLLGGYQATRCSIVLVQ
jgi:hypothetical protein